MAVFAFYYFTVYNFVFASQAATLVPRPRQDTQLLRPSSGQGAGGRPRGGRAIGRAPREASPDVLAEERAAHPVALRSQSRSDCAVVGRRQFGGAGLLELTPEGGGGLAVQGPRAARST
eukprot:11180044-Lingulodinium_polyedra.AAC.1